MNDITKNYYLNSDEQAKLNAATDLIITEINKELELITIDNNLDSITRLFKIQKMLIPAVIDQLKNPVNNLFKTRVLDRINAFIKTTLDTLIKAQELTIKEEIDLTNPKVQLVFSWFIDSIAESLTELDLDKQRFFENFSTKLIGWETNCSKKLSKVSLKALSQSSTQLENPLLKSK